MSAPKSKLAIMVMADKANADIQPISEEGDFFSTPDAAFELLPKGKKKPYAVRIGDRETIYMHAASERAAKDRLLQAAGIGIYPVKQDNDGKGYSFAYDPTDSSVSSLDAVANHLRPLVEHQLSKFLEAASEKGTKKKRRR